MDAEATRDTALRSLAKSQREEESEAESLEKAHIKLRSLQSALETTRSQASSSSEEAEKESERINELEKELSSTSTSSSSARTEAQREIHDIEVSATEKVEKAEDEAEGLRSSLGKTQADLQAATTEGAKAKDRALAEADAALQASRQVQELNTKLASESRLADQNRVRAEALETSQRALAHERDEEQSQLEERNKIDVEERDKLESLESKYSTSARELQREKGENSHLRTQASEFLESRQMAEDLRSQVVSLQDKSETEEKDNAQMKDQLKTLRELKERYASESEHAEQEGNTWHEQVEELQAKVDAQNSKVQALSAQREDALKRAKEASSREDAYFDDNSHLEMQNEALQEQITDLSNKANQSSAQVATLTAEVDRLREAKSQDSENSHAAWLSAENELLGYKKESQTASMLNNEMQAELARTRAVLTDKQRKTLGLPPPGKAPAQPLAAAAAVPPRGEVDGPASVAAAWENLVPAPLPTSVVSQVRAAAVTWQESAVAPAAPSAPAAPVAPAAPARLLSRMAAVVQAKPTALPMTPQVGHLKAVVHPTTGLTQLPGEPRRPVADDTATLAAVDAEVQAGDKVRTPAAPDAEGQEGDKTPLQKLAAYFQAPTE